MLMNVQTKLVAKDRTGDFQAIVERLKSQVGYFMVGFNCVPLV